MGMVVAFAAEESWYNGCWNNCWGGYGVESWDTYTVSTTTCVTDCGFGYNNGCFGTACGNMCGGTVCGNYWDNCGSSCYGWGNYGPLYGTVGDYTGWTYPGYGGWSAYNGAFYAMNPVGGYGACPTDTTCTAEIAQCPTATKAIPCFAA